MYVCTYESGIVDLWGCCSPQTNSKIIEQVKRSNGLIVALKQSFGVAEHFYISYCISLLYDSFFTIPYNRQ